MPLRRRGSRLERAVHWGLLEEVLVETAGRLPDSTLIPAAPLTILASSAISTLEVLLT